MTLRTRFALILSALGVAFLYQPASAQTLYFAGDGSAFIASKWGTAPGGPFGQSFIAGSIAGFSVPNGTGTGSSITVSGINATENFSLTSTSGTISNQGNAVVPITVASGMTLDFIAQAFTSSATAGYIKNGAGTLALAGNTYSGGFTLNDGTVILRGVNALGGGLVNTLTINGGTIAANANRDLSGKYIGGISIGGNFTLGATTGLANTAANLTFSNAVNLGGATRTITIGGSGTYQFNGAVSNGGLIVAATNPNGILGLGGVNSYAGGTTIQSGARLRAGATGALPGDVTNDGELSFAGNINYGGIISGTGSVVNSSGNTTLSGANTYTGKTILGISSTSLTVSSLANGGLASNIEASSNAASNLVIDFGILNYTGPAASTDRLFSLGTGSEGHIASNGTGPLNFTNTGSLGYENATGNRTLYVEGNSDGILAMKTVDPAGFRLTLAKMGFGTWTVTGDSTHTGLTAALQGTLLVNGIQTGTGQGASISQQAMLGGSGRINGGVFVQAGDTIQLGARLRGGVPGTTGTLTFAGGSSVVANTTTNGGLANGGGFEVEASRTGGNGTTGTADASLVVFGGRVNFSSLAAGTPTATSPKFVIDLRNGTNGLLVGESYTITILTATEIQRNGIRVGELSSYTFSPNDYVLSSPVFPSFDNASLEVVSGNTLQLTFTPVPEPTTILALTAVGLAVVGYRRRQSLSARPESHLASFSNGVRS